MPDTFFRTFLYGAAAVALGAGAFSVTSRDTPMEKEADTASHADTASASLVELRSVRTQQLALPDDSYAEPSAGAAAPGHWQSVAGAMRPAGNDRPAHPRATASATHVAAVQEPVIFVGKDVIELAVPVNPQSGVSASVPIALALATDPAGVPQPLQEAARQMALDFLDNVADVAAVATDPQSAEYFERWQSAAYLSDRAFKMRYGRVAYVQMNQLLAQEAAAGSR